MVSPHILVVSEQPATLSALRNLLTEKPCSSEAVTSAADALARVHREPPPDLVLLELNGGSDGLHTLQSLRRVRPDLNVIVVSAPDDTRKIVEAIRMGARDYVTTPVLNTELDEVIGRYLRGASGAAEASIPLESVEDLGDGHFFVAASPAMRKVRIQAEVLAKIDVPILILGESGTGKGVAAHLIHKLSARSGCRFLKVNCAALPGELLESELFGYERGAFTGASRTKAGKFELCEKGTILLDEVAEMPSSLQAKLLHVLQDKQFFRLGGEATIDVDVRILAATNVDVGQAMAERRLREDLYYRLSAFTILLPPLRERQQEIPLLLRHFMSRMAAQYSRPMIPFTPTLIDACLHYRWPGNMRELENFVKRYLVMADESLALSELKSKLHTVSEEDRLAQTHEAVTTAETDNSRSEEHTAGLRSLVRSIKGETERSAIANALEQTRWNRKAAARLLKVSYRTLLYKIQQYHMSPPGMYFSPFLTGNGNKGNGQGK